MVNDVQLRDNASCMKTCCDIVIYKNNHVMIDENNHVMIDENNLVFGNGPYSCLSRV